MKETQDPQRMHLVWCHHVYALEAAHMSAALAARMAFNGHHVELLRALGSINDEAAAERAKKHA